MIRTLAVVILCAAVCSASVAQPVREPVDPERARAMLKARLEDRLAEARQTEARLEAAIQRLERGDSASDVRADLEAHEVPERPRWDGRRPGGDWQGPPPEPGQGQGPMMVRERREGRMPPPPPAEREAFFQALQEQAPELARRINAERESNPAMAERMLSSMEPRLRLLLAERDAEMRELRRMELRAGLDVLASIRALGAAARSGEGPDRVQELAHNVRGALIEHFDARQAMQEREVELLERQLSQLRREMSEYAASRDEMISRRLESIVRFATQPRPTDEGGDRPGRRERPRPPR